MNGRYLLDTNIIIALFADELIIKENLKVAKEIFIPNIAVGELYYGARKSNRCESNLKVIDLFISQNMILNCDVKTSHYYGIIKNNLRSKGRPLPENDIWIAAISLQYNLTLVTRDSHFQEVDNLSTISWS